MIEVTLGPNSVALFGIFLGVFMRTLLPYLKKLRDDGTLEFDHKFTATAITSMVFSFVGAMLLFQTFEVPQSAMIYVFVAAFMEGWTSNDIINMVI